MALKLPTQAVPFNRDKDTGGMPGTTTPATTAPQMPGVGATYPYETGKDPTYDAWIAQFGYQKQKAQSDADFRLAGANQAYTTQNGAIDNTAKDSRTNLQTSLLQRGVFGSGETTTRGAELEADVLRQHAAADATYATQTAGFSKDLADAIAALDVQNQSQMAQAIDRIKTKELLEQQAAAGSAPAAAAPAPAAAPRAAAPRTPAPAAPRPIAAAAPAFGAGLGKVKAPTLKPALKPTFKGGPQ